MPIAKYLYRKSDGRFIGGGFYDVQPPMVPGPNDPQGNPTQVSDWVNYGVAEFGDADQPNIELDMFDAASPNKRRRMTAPELVTAKDGTQMTQASQTSRQVDVLTTVAFIVRRSNVAAWNAMKSSEKKAAVLTAADEWRDLQVFVQKAIL